MPSELETAKAKWEADFAAFKAVIAENFPGMTEWHWYRAFEAIENPKYLSPGNDDPSQDQALHDCDAIRVANDKYLASLHAFYLLRDGPRGVLGGCGL